MLRTPDDLPPVENCFVEGMTDEERGADRVFVKEVALLDVVVAAAATCDEDRPPFWEDAVTVGAPGPDEDLPGLLDKLAWGGVTLDGQIVTVTTEVPGVTVDSDKENDAAEVS